VSEWELRGREERDEGEEVGSEVEKRSAVLLHTSMASEKED